MRPGVLVEEIGVVFFGLLAQALTVFEEGVRHARDRGLGQGSGVRGRKNLQKKRSGGGKRIVTGEIDR
jgi:hypothetical protein